MTAQPVRVRIPGDIVLEPGERVILATKPLAFWLPVAIVVALLWLYVLTLVAGDSVAALALSVVVAVAVTVVAGFAWIRWRARWFVLTDRRIITRSGVLNRVYSAILLDRLQNVTLERPFPLSLIRGYGLLRLESAGEHFSTVRITMEHADVFHRELTEAVTPGR